MMTRTTTRALLAALMLGLATATAEAASYDPDLTWRVITTEHFDIHFHQGEEELAERFSHMLEDVYDRMTVEMQWEPRRRTQLVLVDRTDAANGYAMTAPWNTIVIYVTAPQEDSSLSFYEDWSEAIAIHELTHILHLDTNHGIVRLARSVVGRVASTNQLSPWWMVEGLATFQETRHTTGGRGRTPMVDMIKRTSVVEGEFPPLGNLDGLQADPPSGNLRYLFGQDFIQHVSDHYGEDVWTKWTHTYGGWVPYALPSKRVFGKRLVPLYREWRAAMTARYEAQAEAIRAEGLREGRLISDGEASCAAPSFSPDGEKLLWTCYDLATGSGIWLADGFGQDPELLLERVGAKSFTWRRDSKAFVYAGSHIVNRFNTWSDIYMHTLGKEGVTALTSGARARDPDFSPDGSELMVVTNRVQQNQLQVMTVDKVIEPVATPGDDTQLSTPRYSPDGRVVALSVWKDARRDLWLYSPEGEPLRRLTFDAWTDRDPEWSADGRWLYFSSDRSGVPNVYAIEIDTERLYQVTNVLTGAAAPTVSPDGRLLAYQQYSADGWDVRILDLEQTQLIDRGLLPRPIDQAVAIRELTSPVDAAVAPAELTWVGEPVELDHADFDANVALDEVLGPLPHSHAPPARGGSELPPGLPSWPSVRATAMGVGSAQAPSESIDTFEQADVEDAFGEEQDYPFSITPRRYNPLQTAVPSYWLPYFQLTPFEADRLLPVVDTPGNWFGYSANAFTGGTDTLRHISWAADLSYRNDADFFGGGAALTINRWLPVYSAGLRHSAVPYGNIQLTTDEPVGEDGEVVLVDSGERYWEQRTSAYVSVSYPYTARTWVFARYSLTDRSPLVDVPEDAYLPLIPVRGRVGAIQGGWRYSWSEGTAYSISTENGRIFSLVGGLLHPWLGTSLIGDDGKRQPFTQLQLTSELREYVVNPWVPNHVLAMRVAGGVTVGPTDYLGNYQLGGNWGDAAYYATPDEFRMVRGHPLGADVGDMYWLAGLEYRAPIVRIDRGVGTIPLFLRYVSGAAFIDAGNAFIEPPQTLAEGFEGSLVGVGAELRTSFVAGWAMGFQTRLGYAIGLDPMGYRPGDLGAFYLLGGTSF